MFPTSRRIRICVSLENRSPSYPQLFEIPFAEFSTNFAFDAPVVNEKFSENREPPPLPSTPVGAPLPSHKIRDQVSQRFEFLRGYFKISSKEHYPG